AELLRAGMLTEVRPPTPEEEAVRDLCRCREDATEDLLRSRHRLSKWLLRRGLCYEGRNWSVKHRQWLRSLRFEHAADEAVFTDYLLAIEVLEERLKCLERRLEEMAQTEPYREPVGWLRCFRGIDTVIAMTVVAELHGFERFHSPRQLMAYLGLTPSEHSSGGQERRGPITKAGNSHVRRLLVQAAWHYRLRPSHSYALNKRREGQPSWVIAQADKAQLRLHQRYRHLTSRGKPTSKAVIALTRELVGFLWSVLSRKTGL
ncbi:MAG: IS110 family transposase, partial [Deltaproteobacteria bacterium]|nr:IS110 family transposase [Deltaproteobacteria bacterium]